MLTLDFGFQFIIHNSPFDFNLSFNSTVALTFKCIIFYLQDIIKRKRVDFERTTREIEAEVRRAEAREANEEPTTPVNVTPERPRRSRKYTIVKFTKRECSEK